MKHKKNTHPVAIIIPMHNEEIHVNRCVQKVLKEIARIPYRSKLLVVDDGSTDQTNTILNMLTKHHKKTMCITRHQTNRGYGGAIKTGIQTAVKQKFEYAIIMDSDLTNNPKFIHAFVQRISDGYDIVKACRYTKESIIRGVPIYRTTISRIGNFIASKLFRLGIQDCTNGFRMIRLSQCKNIPYREPGFASIVEELYYIKKYHGTCTEISTELTSRTTSSSHFRYTIGTFWRYLKYAICASLL